MQNLGLETDKAKLLYIFMRTGIFFCKNRKKKKSSVELTNFSLREANHLLPQWSNKGHLSWKFVRAMGWQVKWRNKMPHTICHCICLKTRIFMIGGFVPKSKNTDLKRRLTYKCKDLPDSKMFSKCLKCLQLHLKGLWQRLLRAIWYQLSHFPQ